MDILLGKNVCMFPKCLIRETQGLPFCEQAHNSTNYTRDPGTRDGYLLSIYCGIGSKKKSVVLVVAKAPSTD